MSARYATSAVFCIFLLFLSQALGGCDDDAGVAGTPDAAGIDSGEGPMSDGGSMDGDGSTGNGDPADAGNGTATPDAGDAGEVTAFRDVTLEMSDMDPHVDQMMQFQILSSDEQTVEFRGILDWLPDTEHTYEMPSSTPEGEHQVDFFADLSMNQDYNAPADDHAWRESIASSGDVSVDFVHNTEFTDIPLPAPGGDFTFEATDMDPHLEQLFELRVIDGTTGQVVGRYVLPAIEESQFSFTIPGILEEGREYQIDYFADLNENGQYDPPSTDHAWRRIVTADASGASVNFPHGTDFTDVGF